MNKCWTLFLLNHINTAHPAVKHMIPSESYFSLITFPPLVVSFKVSVKEWEELLLV